MDTSAIVQPPPAHPALPDIVRRYLDGASMQDLAAECGKHPRTLYRWMLSECGPEYEQQITECLINRIADADQKLEESRDNCQIARAREQAKFARMDFERRRPKLYGPKQELDIDSKVTVIIQRLSDPQPVVIGSQAVETMQATGLQPIDSSDSSAPNVGAGHLSHEKS